MVSAICPLRTDQLKEWLYDEIVLPYLEGLERIKKVFDKYNDRSIYQPKLSLKEKFIFLITGLPLLIPFFNALVWKIWETVGSPVMLSPLYVARKKPAPASPSSSITTPTPSEEPSPIALEPLVPQTAPVQPVVQEQRPEKVEILHYSETKGSEPPILFECRNEYYPDKIVHTRTGKGEVTKAKYTRFWKILDYEICNGEGRLKIKRHGERLVIEGKKKGEDSQKREEVLDKTIPWIQQPTFGFQTFTRSDDTEFTYCTVFFDGTLRKFTAKKRGRENVVPFGELLKIDVTWSIFAWTVMQVWVDPQSGLVRKLVVPSYGFNMLYCPDHP